MQRHLRQEAQAQSVLRDTHDQLRKLTTQHQDRVKKLLASMGRTQTTARLENITASFQGPVAQISAWLNEGCATR